MHVSVTYTIFKITIGVRDIKRIGIFTIYKETMGKGSFVVFLEDLVNIVEKLLWLLEVEEVSRVFDFI